MAEAGLIASVVGIASAGIKLSVTLYSFAESVSSADKSIKAIANDVSLTSSVLEELGINLKKDHHSTTYSDQGLKTAEKVVSECSRVFNDIEDALGKSISRVTDGNLEKDARRNFTLSALEKLKWPFLEPKMKLLRSNLDRLKSTLILLLNVLPYARKLKTEEPKASSRTYDRHLIETLVQANREAIKKYEELQKALLPTMMSNQATNTPSISYNSSAPLQYNSGATEQHLVHRPSPAPFLSTFAVQPNEKLTERKIQDDVPDVHLGELHTPQIRPPSNGLSADDLTALLGHINDLVGRLEKAQSTLQKQNSNVKQDVEIQAYLHSHMHPTPSRSLGTVCLHSSEPRHLSSSSQSHTDKDITSGTELVDKKPPKRKRTRAGCLTCRKRRIKCGEERPSCHSCIKSERTCNGYDQRIIFKSPFNSISSTGAALNHEELVPTMPKQKQSRLCLDDEVMYCEEPTLATPPAALRLTADNNSPPLHAYPWGPHIDLQPMIASNLFSEQDIADLLYERDLDVDGGVDKLLSQWTRHST